MPDLDQPYELECPHCHKTFTAEVMAGGAARHTGFKCPHCRLFVPFERVAGDAERVDGGDST
jgi:hypothetical protein